MPRLALTIVVSFWVSKPLTKALPESGIKIVDKHLSVVVLPEPFGPRRPKSSPERIFRLTLSNATVTLFWFWLLVLRKKPKIPLCLFFVNRLHKSIVWML